MSNRKPSIRQLREGTELMSESAVTTLLNYVGKKPLRRTPLKLENEEIERILRGYDLNMSYNDIGHFVQRNPRLVQEIFLKHKPRPRSTHILARVPLGDGQHKVLMPWQASVIYQAQHEGMSDADISKTLDLPMAAVEYAMQKRSSIEPDIIHALNVFYPEQKHELPFLVTTSARGA